MRLVLLFSAAALVMGGSLTASAQLCDNPNGCGPNIPVQPLLNELRTIDSGAYKQSGTWRNVPEHQRPTEWPLCLEPNKQNAERLKDLEKK